MQLNKLFKGALEERFFVIVLLCTIPYYLLNLATIFSYNDTNPVLVGIYSALLVISFAALYLKYKWGINQIVISSFSLLLLSAFTYYLPKSGGPTGGAGYVLQNIIVLSILMTKGRLRVFITIALIGVTAVLYTDVFTFSGEIIYTRLLTDYAMNLAFISIFMLFFKYNLIVNENN